MSQQVQPIVFVVQIPIRRDKMTNIEIPAMNIKPAEEYGQIQVLMPSHTIFFPSVDLTEMLCGSPLLDYNFERGDCILCLGNPEIIGMVTALLVQWGCDAINFLRWDRRIGRYAKVTWHLPSRAKMEMLRGKRRTTT